MTVKEQKFMELYGKEMLIQKLYIFEYEYQLDPFHEIDDDIEPFVNIEYIENNYTIEDVYVEVEKSIYGDSFKYVICTKCKKHFFYDNDLYDTDEITLNNVLVEENKNFKLIMNYFLNDLRIKERKRKISQVLRNIED